MSASRLPALSALACVALAWSPASAESLLDAIRLAHDTNPSLRQQAAVVREADEGLVQARAGYGPQINFQAQGSYQHARIDFPKPLFGPSQPTDYRAGTGTADLSVVQPLYTHGQTLARVRGADAGIIAAREDMRESDAELVQSVITAYVDVRRDRASVKILQDEIVALSAECDEMRAKGKLGQLSKTDVSQAEARLLSARADLDLTQGRLAASSANYLDIVGQPPGELDPEPDLIGLPESIDQALESAEHDNPQLAAAFAQEQQAREVVNEARAANGPTLSLKIDAQAQPYAPYLPNQYDRSASAALVLSTPLFTSGYNSSKIREALDADDKARAVIDQIRRGVIERVTQSWNQMTSNQRAAELAQKQIDQEGVSVEGYRVEERVGLRSTVDLLNAEQEISNARIALLSYRHDSYVAQSVVLAMMGILEAHLQTTGVVDIPPQVHLNKVKGIGATPWQGVIQAFDGLASPAASVKSTSH